MKICGVRVCTSGEHQYKVICRECPHYVDADEVIHFLLDALEDEHKGIKSTYSYILKNDFGYEKEFD